MLHILGNLEVLCLVYNYEFILFMEKKNGMRNEKTKGGGSGREDGSHNTMCTLSSGNVHSPLC